MSRSAEEISRDVGEARSRLRDTSAALGYKADIPARAGEALRETSRAVMEQLVGGEPRRDRSTTDPSSSAAARAHPLLLGLGAALAGAIAGLALSKSHEGEEQLAQPATGAASQLPAAVEDAADVAETTSAENLGPD